MLHDTDRNLGFEYRPDWSPRSCRPVLCAMGAKSLLVLKDSRYAPDRLRESRDLTAFFDQEIEGTESQWAVFAF